MTCFCCRQWALAPGAIRSVRVLMASPVLLFTLCGEGGEGILPHPAAR